MISSANIEKMKVSISTKITNHDYAQKIVLAMPDPNGMPIEEVIERIIMLNEGLRIFWNTAEGWAPIEAAKLLNKSRLDRQISLSHCLKLWVATASAESQDGRLILAWANLGSLIEGSMKLFLSVWYKTYKSDIDAIKQKGKLQNPDGLQLEPLRLFFKQRVWDSTLDGFVLGIQQRRNAIHAFKDRNIGTKDEFISNVRGYLKILRYINFRLPYPDDICIPRET
jgi:hypothetical protein